MLHGMIYHTCSLGGAIMAEESNLPTHIQWTEPSPLEKLKALIYLPYKPSDKVAMDLIKELDPDQAVQLLYIVELRVTGRMPYIGKGVCISALRKLAQSLDERHAELLPTLKSYLAGRCEYLVDNFNNRYYRYDRYKPIDAITAGICRLIARIGTEEATAILVAHSFQYPFIAKIVTRLIREHRLPVNENIMQVIQDGYPNIVQNAQIDRFRSGLAELLRCLKSRTTEPTKAHIESILAILNLGDNWA